MKKFLPLLLTGLLSCLLVSADFPCGLGSPPNPEPSQPETMIDPAEDRLAIPVLPENPTQVELGSDVYYYNCMPCHGDQGQGLTDEFRQLWVEDHQNCWAGGCHGGRERDQGFPIPHYITGLRNLSGYAAPEDLFNYLQQTHPPQRPGKLLTEEYWAVTAFILDEAGRLPQGERIGPPAESTPLSDTAAMLAILMVMAVVSLLLIWQTRQPIHEIEETHNVLS
ncbi:MAG: hypothetical protein JXB15_17520 [Anaerolineales bacterium]|nr:hypothetical protein [Anaerolineales bacterium]